MPIYSYEATDQAGEPSAGELLAADEKEAAATLLRKKLTIIRLEEKAIHSGLKASFSPLERFTALDRIIFTRNLAATVKAGLSLIEALDILINDANKRIIKEVLTSAKTGLQNGQSLSAVLELYPKYFPPIFIGMIRAGENSGDLDKALDELSRHLNKEYNLRKKVKSALAYPLILLLVSVAIVALLLAFVLPRLTKTFAQSQVELPLITKILIKASAVVTFSWWLDALVVAALVFFLGYFRKTGVGRRFFGRLAFAVPVSKVLVKKVVLVRITRTLGSLVASAISIIEAMELTEKVAGNIYYEKALKEMSREIKNGVALSEAARKHPDLFPMILVSLLAVGEKTGTLEEVLKNFADFYDEEVDGALKDLATFIEPILLLLMGLVVGGISLSILLPIYQLVGKFV